MTIPSGSRAKRAPSAPASSAVVARSAARPNSCMIDWSTACLASGPCSPETWSSTAGNPAAAGSPCSETVSGTARRIHWPTARGPPACSPTSWRTARSTVRRSPSGAI